MHEKEGGGRLMDQDAKDDEVLDAKGVAEMLKVSSRTVLRLAERGELPYFRVGDLWRFQRSDVIDYINRNKQGKRSSTPSDKS
jgi:excisionase family DNA binding protein